jgi:hypothetical protein
MSSLATARNLGIAAVLAGALLSNPDESSFRLRLERDLRASRGEGAANEAKIADYVASHAIARRNFFLFSTVRLPVEKRTYLGAFGNWLRLPRLFVRRY